MNAISAAGKVVIISVSDGFLAKSLLTKLDKLNIPAVFSHAELRELENYVADMELAILFMSEELKDMPDTLVFLKDTIEDKDLGLILIGDEEVYELVKKTIPSQAITDFFKRPLDIDQLVKRINTYFDENTGDKRKKNILIVDDDITYMRTVYEWLKDSYHVGMAPNGVQAISYLAKHKADLVLLDYEMPVTSGPCGTG